MLAPMILLVLVIVLIVSLSERNTHGLNPDDFQLSAEKKHTRNTTVASDKTNFIIILADDLGIGDVGKVPLMRVRMGMRYQN
jgi:hypothetical protein